MSYFLLAGILALSAYLRLIGLNWDDNFHLHPDERFMTMVASSVSFPEKASDYFNTAVSPLNPHNRGYGFYVYGTLPLFITRSVAEQFHMTGYDEIFLVGRVISAIADTFTVGLVYLIAIRLFRRRGIALLAAAFSTCSVLQIQLSHYFTVDILANFFTFVAFYFAVCAMDPSKQVSGDGNPGENADQPWWKNAHAWVQEEGQSLTTAALFGLGLGVAMASKVSAAPLALLLPAAALIFFSRLHASERRRWLVILVRNLVVGAAVSLLAFRIFQPYAFNGPGFFGLGINAKWLNNLKDLSQQSGGNVDFPPALQWARRPLTFAWENMVLWGLGLPLGILGWAGFLCMGWRILKGEWRQYAIIWGWTLIYFAWQSLNFSRSMRYQLPVYPTLAIIAAWLIMYLWDRASTPPMVARHSSRMRLTLVVSLAALVLILTAAWAYAFTRIYTRPVTRVAASEWIYQNVPAAINLRIFSGDGEFNQPVSFKHKLVVDNLEPVRIAFTPRVDGFLTSLSLSHVVRSQLSEAGGELFVKLYNRDDDDLILSSGILESEFSPGDDPRGKSYTLSLQPAVEVTGEKDYLLVLGVLGDAPLSLAGTMSVEYLTRGGGSVFQSLADPVDVVRPNKPYTAVFTVQHSGLLERIQLPKVADWEGGKAVKTLRFKVSGNGIQGEAEINSTFAVGEDPRGHEYVVEFSPALEIEKWKQYTLEIDLKEGNGAIGLYGSRAALESSWDDALPLGMDGYNPFDYESGTYRTDLNFEMYWDDNPEKLQRFISTLDQADYIFISSNRQWGTTTRVPERYPLTTKFYRSLIGCPEDVDILRCYRVAEPGMFSGELGFDLVKVFQSDPNLGSIRFNTQFAEEAFTVYDHPKVLIFKKTAAYSEEAVRDLLSSVDLTNIVHVPPGQVYKYREPVAGLKNRLMLTGKQLQIQQAGGTWSEMFNRQALHNRFPVIGLILWYLAVLLLGLVVYPLVRLVFGGLSDNGYPFSRLVAVVLLAFLVWLAGSANIPVTRLTIHVVVGILVLVNAYLGWLQRDSLISEFSKRKRYFLLIEGLALGFFLLFLFIRLGNPDLWHPYKGGEKPMDFSYLNAVIKSTIFPPYDPWFAGGYINYYYYGFVMAGIPVKWLGIIPSIAYNLILPTWFSLFALGAFSLGWNLLSPREDEVPVISRLPFLAGLASTTGLLLLGNLGTVRMIWHGLMKLASSAPLEGSTFFQKLSWTIQGTIQFFSGVSLPYGPGDWYWIPSRVMPGEPITEFPLFTFLYADPHAHLFAFPVTVLVLAWVLAIIQRKWHWTLILKNPLLELGSSLLVGAVAVGTLRPTNTWDFPTFLVICSAGILFASGRYAGDLALLNRLQLSLFMQRLVQGLLYFAVFLVFSFVFFEPYARYYGQGYNAIQFWEGERSPFFSYLTHWGLFLFVLTSWYAWETKDWMEKTPVSALNRLHPYRHIILSGLALVFLVPFVLALFLHVTISWLVFPLAVWAGILILRPGQPDEKRLVLFLSGSALFITLVVELFVLKGDLGRMNTVFKFYLQVWTMFAVSSGAAVIWLFRAVERTQRIILAGIWQALFILLGCGAALFTIVATVDKITDRMTRNAPHRLDGMSYMAYSTYWENNVTMDLSQDYRAIRWMQDHVLGSPTIVEANTPEYRWGSRYTIYTGLPGVVGWNWHQRQQRAVLSSELITERVEDIRQFYTTADEEVAVDFLNRYHVRYIISGQLEWAVYPGAGMEKFEAFNGLLWSEVYRDDNTVIYEVME